MVDKRDYYHGATLIQAIEDTRFRSIKLKGTGYVINDQSIVYLKYTTKSKSPWRFTFSQNELSVVHSSSSDELNIFFVFICNGIGFCAVKYQELLNLLDHKPNWIAISRKFNAQFKVSGQIGSLVNRIPYNRWPKILFEKQADLIMKKDD
jgi:hypothetical protein